MNLAKNSVIYAGTTEKAAIDLGLKFKLIETRKIKVTNQRLSPGTQEVKGKVLGAYNYED